MNHSISRYVDDFLPGSVTVYNYNPVISNNYFIYCQIAGFQKIGPRYFNELKNYPNYLLNLSVLGEGRIIIDNEEHVLEKGDLVFLHNGLYHKFYKKKDTDWHFYFLHIFESGIVSELYRKYVKHCGYIIKGLDVEELKPYFAKIIQLLKDKKGLYEVEISVLIYKILLTLIEKNVRPEIHEISHSISDVVLYIQNNYTSNIAISSIYKKSPYSKNHLERLFKEKMHMTINEYLYTLRLRRAQELLLTTNLSLKEVAEKSGFVDYRALHYIFKKRLQCTPTDYRDNKGLSK